MNRFTTLLLVFVMACAIPVYAAEQHELTFEWSYPDTQNNVINGFRIYEKVDTGKSLVLEVTNTMMRMAKKVVTLNKENTEFFIVPFIGTREGPPVYSNTVKIAPFYPVNSFTVKCPTCGPAN